MPMWDKTKTLANTGGATNFGIGALAAAPGVPDAPAGGSLSMLQSGRTRNWLRSGDADLWVDDESGQMTTIDPNNKASGAIAERWGPDASVSDDGLNVYLPDQNIHVPINADGTQDMVRSTQNRGNVVTNSLTSLAGSKVGSVLSGRAVLQGGVKEQDMSSAGILDVFGSPATAGTKQQGAARAAAIAYGGYMAAGALAGAAGSGATGSAAADSSVLAGAGDMFGSGAVYEAGAAGLGTGAAAAGGTVGLAEAEALGTISTGGSTGATTSSLTNASSASSTLASGASTASTAARYASLASDVMGGVSALGLLAGGAAAEEPAMPSLDDAPLPQRGEIEAPTNQTRQMQTRAQRLDAQARAAGAQRSGNQQDTRGKRPNAPKQRGPARRVLSEY
jgi:hypothetical protein